LSLGSIDAGALALLGVADQMPLLPLAASTVATWRSARGPDSTKP
jgi:hypothetical protein